MNYLSMCGLVPLLCSCACTDVWNTYHLLGPRVIPYLQEITDAFPTSGQILNFTSHTFVLESLYANDLSLTQSHKSCQTTGVEEGGMSFRTLHILDSLHREIRQHRITRETSLTCAFASLEICINL
jgi:hypothetical protein